MSKHDAEREHGATSATDIATRIEMIEANNARPSQTADTNQTFSIAHSFGRMGRSW
jgi:hypothetical protein